MGKRVRGRKRDGRRSSLPPPPAGEVGEAGTTDAAASESVELAGETDEQRDTEGRESDAPDSGDSSSESLEAASEAYVEVVAVDVRVLPVSASALLSAALPSRPSSAQTKAASPAHPTSEAKTEASPEAAVTTESDTDLGEAKTAAVEGDAPELTPVVDMPALLEASSASSTNGTESSEPTRPDATPLTMELNAADADAGEPPLPPQLSADPGPPRPVSVPDPTEIGFFDAAAVAAHVARAHEPSDAHDIHSLSQAELLHRRRRMPEVAARRDRLARIVQITVGTAGALLILAVLLHLSARNGQAGSAGPQMLVAPPAMAPEGKDAVKTTGATMDKTPATSGSAATSEATDAAVAPVDPSALAAGGTGLVTDASAGEAAALAAMAQLALEKGKLKDAIDAGEQATTLDGTDARAWLVLGGAYQERGDMLNARRCYNACAEHATHGPVNECRALGGR